MRSMPVRNGGWCIITSVGRVGRCAERAVEPGETLVAQLAAAVAGDVRIERDQPHRVILDRILQKAVARQIAVAAERGAQQVAAVVIAGDDEDRHRERRQQPAQMLVFRRLARGRRDRR